MFKKKSKTTLLSLFNEGVSIRDIPFEVGMAVLEKIKNNQQEVQVKITIGILRRTILIDTRGLFIEKIEKNDWLIKFGEYDMSIYGNIFIQNSIHFKWIDSSSFKLTIEDSISDPSNMYVHFYGNIGELTKEQYFKE